jgi:uncharacterized membrane protein
MFLHPLNRSRADALSVDRCKRGTSPVARRIDSLDVARGAAMLFVCLSHFTGNYLATPVSGGASSTLSRSVWVATTVSMIASPTFVAVSALVVGYLYRVHPAGMPELRRKLIDRGLFLLLIGHIIQVPVYAPSGKMGDGVHLLFITDVIGLAIIIGPTLMMRTAPITRLLGGAALITSNWLATAFWVPGTEVGRLVARYALGVLDATGDFVGFPPVPWFAVYLLMTVVGERLGEHARAGEFDRSESVLSRIGAASMAMGAAFAIARRVLGAVAPGFVVGHGGLSLWSVSHKFPPGPVYLLFFGGAGLMLIARAFALSRASSFGYLTRPIAALGRASFFVFVLQGYVYYLVLPPLHLPFPHLWPGYYVVTVLLLVGAANIWDHFDGNRYLSVGLWHAVPFARTVRARFVRRQPATS